MIAAQLGGASFLFAFPQLLPQADTYQCQGLWEAGGSRKVSGTVPTVTTAQNSWQRVLKRGLGVGRGHTKDGKENKLNVYPGWAVEVRQVSLGEHQVLTWVPGQMETLTRMFGGKIMVQLRTC